VFANDAARAFLPPDPEIIQAVDAIWQGPWWRGLAMARCGRREL
jgi:hypothetical protein